jgi:hypothetical protein
MVRAMLTRPAGIAGRHVGGIVGPGADIFEALMSDLPVRGAAFGGDALMPRTMAIRFGATLGAHDGGDAQRAFVHIRGRGPPVHDRPSMTSLLSRVLSSVASPGAVDPDASRALQVRPHCCTTLRCAACQPSAACARDAAVE